MKLTAHVRKKLGDVRLNARLEVSGSTRVLALFGPSGAGKTTLLRCLAGLERPDEGRIEFGGETWFGAGKDLRPQGRRIGFLFQESALFPHMTARENLRYAAESFKAASHQNENDEADLSADVSVILELERLLDRYPRQLSAGERQRVALARALASKPRLLLLDEPFSALDQPTRERLRGELKRALTALRIPAVLVTHDRAEAHALADHLALLCDGEVVQAGSVEEVFARPKNLVAARAVGFDTIIPSEHLGEAPGRLACVRGEDLILARGGRASSLAKDNGAAASEDWRGTGRVSGISREGASVRVAIECGFSVVAIVGKREFAGLGLSEGEEASVAAPAHVLHWITV